MMLPITKKHLSKGRRKDVYAHPLAIATRDHIRRKHGIGPKTYASARLMDGVLTVAHKNKDGEMVTGKYSLSPEAIDFANRVDAGYDVKPTEVEIEVA